MPTLPARLGTGGCTLLSSTKPRCCSVWHRPVGKWSCAMSSGLHGVPFCSHDRMCRAALGPARAWAEGPPLEKRHGRILGYPDTNQRGFFDGTSLSDSIKAGPCDPKQLLCCHSHNRCCHPQRSIFLLGRNPPQRIKITQMHCRQYCSEKGLVNSSIDSSSRARHAERSRILGTLEPAFSCIVADRRDALSLAVKKRARNDVETITTMHASMRELNSRCFGNPIDLVRLLLSLDV